MPIKTFAQCYIVYIFISIYSLFYINMYIFFIVLYIEEKHLTTIVKNVLLNTNYSQNTSLFMTYYLEPFHNKYKSVIRLLYRLLLKVHFGYDVDFFKARNHCIKCNNVLVCSLNNVYLYMIIALML